MAKLCQREGFPVARVVTGEIGGRACSEADALPERVAGSRNGWWSRREGPPTAPMQGLVGESHKALTDDLPHCQPTQHRLHMTAICTSLPGRRVRHRERPRRKQELRASLHPEVERLLREAREDRSVDHPSSPPGYNARSKGQAPAGGSPW